MNQIKVLLVGTEELIYEYVSRDLDYEFYLAANGKEALQSFMENRPDVVIADVDTPSMDIAVFANIVKKIDSFTPIIIITGKVEIDALIRFKDYFIQRKPFFADDLNRKITEAARYKKDVMTIVDTLKMAA